MSGGHPHLIIVEGLSFSSGRDEDQGFDKLSPDGEEPERVNATGSSLSELARGQPSALGASAMGFFKNLFTWWDGATLGTALFSWKNGRKVGSDAAGNSYFEAKKGGRRWVMYAGPNDVSRVPPEWYAWLTRQIEGLPDDALPPAPRFLKAATPNLTGTADAYRPTGALEKGGRRQAASGDYQAWTPD